MNYQMLLTLVNNNIQNRKESSWEYDSDDNDMDWSQWIDSDLSDDVNCLEDPDFIIPEEVAENSITTSSATKNYNLRSRNRLH
jgi:hypothetical protein